LGVVVGYEVGDSVLGLAEAGGAGTTGDPVDAIVGALVPEALVGLFDEIGEILGLAETGAAVTGGS
jgi:hypothetical protein